MDAQINKKSGSAGRACGVIVLAALFLLPRQCCARESGDIRVLIVDGAASVTVSAAGPYRIAESGRGRTLHAGQNLNARFTVSQGAISFAGKNFPQRTISIIPDAGQHVEINNRAYTGSVQLMRTGPGRISAVNCIGLEDYVKGVAVRETSHYWPMEALKAQVVAFRTFAVYKQQESGARDFDVTADVFSQGYGGRAAERYRISDAADQTKGEVLFYAGKILPAFFHSTCAGRTEDAAELWKLDIPPLKGVACGFCKESPHFSWKAAVSKEKIREGLSKKYPGIPLAKEVAVRARNASGRATMVMVTTEKGDFAVPAKDFRLLIGQDIIRSTLFTVSAREKEFFFEGTGWGHGAGLCQWGAYFMAKKGADYHKILSHYYPRSVLQKIRE